MSKIIEVDLNTGNHIERDYTQSELDSISSVNQVIQNIIDSPEYQEEILLISEQVALKQSAINKLMSLGLTEDEAKAIAGI